MTFSTFAKAIQNNYNKMAKDELYVIKDEENKIWETYLNAFPEGTDPIFKERTTHDCNCCKQFIRRIGKVVTIKDGMVKSIWDVPNLPYPYDIVAKELQAFVESKPIFSIFRSKEHLYGKETTKSITEEGNVVSWNHFEGKVFQKHHSNSVGTEIGISVSNAQVLSRGLNEISVGTLNTLIELINTNSIYRGSEFKRLVVEFKSLKIKFDKVNNKELFIWENLNSFASKFRNSVTGTLAVDIESGDLESAVKKYEAKVAPENYKRPKALVTKKMVEDAMKTLRELDLESAVERRYATIEDVSVNDVLFVDNSVQEKMKGGIEGLLLDSVKPTQPKGTPKPISMDDFLANVVPNATSLKLKVEKPSNFVSLTAPVDSEAGNLFSWGNNFAWSYINEVADSVAERVKKAGGRVDNAVMRFSLAWFNRDDLDIHVVEPNGNHIYYGNRSGKLDVDMNAPGTSQVRDAVENVSWMTKPQDGTYIVTVDNYARRENVDLGYDLHIVNNGQSKVYSFRNSVGQNMKALHVTVKGGVIKSIKPAKNLTSTAGEGETIWNVKVGEFAKVNTLMKSPNHWEGFENGNKHWFFTLEGCENPEETRGIYNEFLKPELQKHKRVFELLGSKAKCPPSDNQLSGIGFSSTKKEKAIIHASGDRLNALYEVNFQ